MKRKITAVILILALLLTPSFSFALDTQDSDGERFKEFSQDGVTYYDIYNGQTKDRPEVDDMDALIEQTLYGKKDGQKYSAAEYWATLATSIFASNPSSWRMNGKDGDHGADKNYQDFQDRLSLDPAEGKDDYGNVQKWLSSKSGKEVSTENKSKYRKCDINMKASGMMTAKNLSQVEDMAFEYLVDVNPGRIKTSHFDSYNSLQGMNEDSTDGDVIYHLMAMRDRDGGTFYYEYNCFGIAFYDFNVQPFTGKEGEGLTTALSEYDNLDEAIDTELSGDDITGFVSEGSSKTHIDRVRNTAAEEVTKHMDVNWSQEESLSSEVSHVEETAFSQGQSASFTFGKDTAFFHAETGFSFTEEELFQDGISSSNSTSKQDGGSSGQDVPIPAHTALEQIVINDDSSSSAKYDCPAMVTYKVAIFSYNGCYYDDNAGTTYFNTAGYEQRSFMTEFGNDADGTGAVENLRERMAKDAGYDASHGLTRGIRQRHASDNDATWDNPWVSYLDYGAMADAANNYLHYSPAHSDTTEFLSCFQPMSITGGLLKRAGSGSDSIIGEAVPIYPLRSVTLLKSQRDEVTLKEHEDLHLKNIRLEAWDSKDIAFYGFVPTTGYWTLVNKSGDQIEDSDVISLKQNKNGDYVVKAKSPGRAYIQYFIPEDTYRYVNQEDQEIYIDPSDVDTPVMTITVKKDDDVPTEIVTSGNVELYYDAPENSKEKVKIDLESVDGLEAVVYNQKGDVMDAEVSWEPAADTDGINIKDNVMTVNKDGTYKLRAVCKDLASEPIEMHVEKRALSQIIVPTEPVNVTYMPGQDIDLDGLEGLTAVPADQTGAAVSGIEVVWEPTSYTASGITVVDGMLTVEQEGTYSIQASGGGITSQGVQLVCSLDEKAAEVQDKVNQFLKCDSEYTSVAEACLFVKNMVGQQCTVNEVIYTELLLQLADAQTDTDVQKEYELQAVIWAAENDILSCLRGQALSIGGGISELQMGLLAYNTGIKFGRDMTCEDVIGGYSGGEALSEAERIAMNWAISKGCLSESEEAAKTLDLDRFVTDAELEKYDAETVVNPEADESDVEEFKEENAAKNDNSSDPQGDEAAATDDASAEQNGDAGEAAAQNADADQEAAETTDDANQNAGAPADADTENAETAMSDDNQDGIYESASGKQYLDDEGTYVAIEEVKDGQYLGDGNGDGVMGNKGDYLYTPDGDGGFEKEVLQSDYASADRSDGKHIGIVIGIAAVVILCGAGAFVVSRRSKRSK